MLYELTNNLDLAATQILQGKDIVLPTDTLYALSCDATNELAVELIYKIKGRAANKPLPILISSIEEVGTYAQLNNPAKEYLNKYWPGALTVVLPIKKNCPLAPNVTNGFNSIALRMPNQNNLLKVMRACNKPLIGTSANLSNHPNLLTPEEIEKSIGGMVSGIFYDQNSMINTPSTIIDFCDTSTPKIIRNGAIKIF